ncbi:DUF4179 domain-containing protein [uncultured Clostridium sp.]|uniref:DUF4179 domain-containing protein n=1 Tax=uncultured Clostridium sp. TaxID=59620 RepID=UPI00258E59C0|nr:DUF4179 domain-containing protein [uncultured Clostridium sp.]
MNPRELLENIDDLEIYNNDTNDSETGKIDMPDIVKERVRKKVKSTLRHRKAKKIKIAASIMIGIFSLAVISTPVIAKNNSILAELYKKVGIFDDFEDYKKFIGMAKEENGFKVTIEEMLVTPNTMIVAVKIQSPTPFLKERNDYLDVSVNGPKLGMTSGSGFTSTQYIDDYNCIIISEADSIEGLFPKKSNISINVRKLNKDLKEEFNIAFDINADFTSAFNDVKKLEINQLLGDVNIKSITSSIIETNLFVKGKDLDGYSLNNAFMIKVDGRYHYGTSTFLSENDAMIEFKTLKYSDINEAENVSVIYTGITEEGLKNTQFEKDIILENEKGITYPKEIVTNSNNKYKISKVERDLGKVKLYIEGDVLPIELFTNLNLLATKSELDSSLWYGTMYEEDSNNYIIEFNNINYEGDLQVYYNSFWKEKNIEDFKEIKIK